MRQKLSPGMMLDFVTPEEMASHFDNHSNTLLKALGRNAQFKRVINSASVSADGSVSIVSAVPDGFLWEVRAVTFSLPNGNTTNLVLSINDSVSTLNFICSAAPGSLTTIPGKTIIAHSNDRLIATLSQNQVAIAGLPCDVCLWVVEVPNSHEAQLLL